LPPAPAKASMRMVLEAGAWATCSAILLGSISNCGRGVAKGMHTSR
jgi:hypothetical protein